MNESKASTLERHPAESTMKSRNSNKQVSPKPHKDYTSSLQEPTEIEQIKPQSRPDKKRSSGKQKLYKPKSRNNDSSKKDSIVSFNGGQQVGPPIVIEPGEDDTSDDDGPFSGEHTQIVNKNEDLQLEDFDDTF